MNSANVRSKKGIAWLIGLAAVVLMLLAFWIIFDRLDRMDKVVTLGGSTYEVEVVDDQDSRSAGLSGREKLDDDKGMLFVFDSDDRHSFWMKDMKFSIDIIWLDNNRKVVHVERDVHPDEPPHQTYSPPTGSRYVLEVGANRSQAVEIGEIAVFGDGV